MKFLFFVLLISSASSNALDEMVSVSEGSYFSESFCFKRRCEHKDVSKDNYYAVTPMYEQNIPTKYGNGIFTEYTFNPTNYYGEQMGYWDYLSVKITPKGSKWPIKLPISNPDWYFTDEILKQYPYAVTNFFNINKIKKNTFHFGDVDSLNGSIEEFNKIAPEELKIVQRYYKLDTPNPFTHSAKMKFLKKFGEDLSWPMSPDGAIHLYDMSTRLTFGLLDQRYVKTLAKHARIVYKYSVYLTNHLKKPDVKQRLVEQHYKSTLSIIRRNLGSEEKKKLLLKSKDAVDSLLTVTIPQFVSYRHKEIMDASFYLSSLLSKDPAYELTDSPPLAGVDDYLPSFEIYPIYGRYTHFKDPDAVFLHEFRELAENFMRKMNLRGIYELANYTGQDLLDIAIKKLEIANQL